MARYEPTEEEKARLAYRIGFAIGPLIGIGLTAAVVIGVTLWFATLYFGH